MRLVGKDCIVPEEEGGKHSRLWKVSFWVDTCVRSGSPRILELMFLGVGDASALSAGKRLSSVRGDGAGCDFV